MPISRRHACCWLGSLPLVSLAQGTDADPTRALHSIFARHWEWSAERFPERATWRGDHRFNQRLGELSPEATVASDRAIAAFRAEAEAIPRERLGPVDRVSRDLFIENMNRQLSLQAHPGYRVMNLRALGGVQTFFSDLLRVMPMASRLHAEQMVQRMSALPRRIAQEVSNHRRAQALGWVPARDVLERVLAQIDGQIGGEIDAGPFFAPFKRLPASLPAEERNALAAAGRDAVARHVLPAMRELRRFVANELLPGAPAEGSLSRHRDGAAVYAILVRDRTTTDLTPEQIHAIGQRELSRLRGEMEAVMRETKFEGDFAAFIRFLHSDPKFFHPSPEALLAGYREIAKRIDAELPKLFAELPRAPYGIVAMPAHLGRRADYYNGPTLDGTRAGFFFANTIAWQKRPTWGMETLTAHETVPGHHLQIARAVELRDLPPFRRSGFGYTAFTEGWALYAETLGFDLGLYADPYSRFGHLQKQAFRAARLVVDTGVHSLGWSRRRAIDFMVERTGMDEEFITGEVDRYASDPGQALAYMIGKIRIDELRDRARTKLGARFDIRRFHNAVLDQGALPLAALERVIDDWIAAQAG